MQKIAILVVDLSAYAIPAATSCKMALIREEYVALVCGSISEGCEMIKGHGSQLIIASLCTEDLVKLVIKLYEEVAVDKRFLPVQGGMHYGEVTVQGANYFGTSISIAARIAARARGGLVLASKYFIYSLAHPESFHYIYYDLLRFKDSSEDIVIVELLPEYNLVAAPDYSNPFCQDEPEDETPAFRQDYGSRVANFYSRIVGKITMQRLLNFSRISAQGLASAL